MTETKRMLYSGLRAFDVPKAKLVEITMRMQEEDQQMELMRYMADHLDATPEELLELARKLTRD